MIFLFPRWDMLENSGGSLPVIRLPDVGPNCHSVRFNSAIFHSPPNVLWPSPKKRGCWLCWGCEKKAFKMRKSLMILKKDGDLWWVYVAYFNPIFVKAMYAQCIYYIFIPAVACISQYMITLLNSGIILSKIYISYSFLYGNRVDDLVSTCVCF